MWMKNEDYLDDVNHKGKGVMKMVSLKPQLHWCITVIDGIIREFLIRFSSFEILTLLNTPQNITFCSIANLTSSES